VGDVVAGETAHLHEVAADVVATGTVGHGHLDAARPLTQPLLRAPLVAETVARRPSGADVVEGPPM